MIGRRASKGSQQARLKPIVDHESSIDDRNGSSPLCPDRSGKCTGNIGSVRTST